MKKVFKILGVILFMIVGFLVGNLFFIYLIAPLNLGPRPVIAAANMAGFIFLFGRLGTIVFKAYNV